MADLSFIDWCVCKLSFRDCAYCMRPHCVSLTVWNLMKRLVRRCHRLLSDPLLSAIMQVFNFTMGVKVEQHSQPLGKAEQDMTKLCNHRRKVVAMAALCRSMQVSQLPFANLHYPGKFWCAKTCSSCTTQVCQTDADQHHVRHVEFSCGWSGVCPLNLCHYVTKYVLLNYWGGWMRRVQY